MNTIKCEFDKSDYGYETYPNFKIENYWLDEKLEELYPNRMFKGLYPTLQFVMEIERERKVVWDRILPRIGKTMICPILMCPDDNDFSCTLIVVEIENFANSVKWNKLGVDKTIEYNAEKVGSKVEWLDKINSLEFSRNEYLNMLSEFRKHYLTEKKIGKRSIHNLNKDYHLNKAFPSYPKINDNISCGIK